MKLVERHVIKSNNEYFAHLLEMTHLSKNLYNQANYFIRKEFTTNNNWLRYGEINKICRNQKEYNDYKAMPAAQVAQQVLMLLDKNWVSFFRSIKDWKNHPTKYLGRPKLPKYLPKNGYNVLTFTNQVCKLKDNMIYFPKSMKGFTIQTKIVNNSRFKKFNQVRIIPRRSYLIIEVVYEVNDVDKKQNDNWMSIDIGLDNLATITSNRFNPVLIDGKGLKSINKYYNSRKSFLQSRAKKCNKLDWTNNLEKLTTKRNFKINDYMHKASKMTIDLANMYNVSKIIIGHNKNQKQKSKLKNFTQVPYDSFIHKITYKANLQGIDVILYEESYTSGTSFLDGEEPVKENYNINRRLKRGLLKSNNGRFINSDVNASLQIAKKVSCDVNFDQQVKGLVFNPVKIYVT